MLPEGKKMRLSGEGASASASPAPMQATEGENGGGVAAATAPEGQQEGPEDEDEEEEDIAVGPDGLRLISDCLASLFETDEAGRTCRLCKYAALSFSFPLRYCTDHILNYPEPDMLEA